MASNDELKEINFTHYDTLERIFSRIQAKTSTAFSDEVHGSAGGLSQETLTRAEVLSAVGWIERLSPFGAALLRATFMDDRADALRRVYYEWTTVLKASGEAPQAEDVFALAVVTLDEHTRSHTMERCRSCKGVGEDGEGVCPSCQGFGESKFELRPYTRYTRFKSEGGRYSRRKFEKLVVGLYGDLMRGLGDKQGLAAVNLLEVLRKP